MLGAVAARRLPVSRRPPATASPSSAASLPPPPLPLVASLPLPSPPPRFALFTRRAAVANAADPRRHFSARRHFPSADPLDHAVLMDLVNTFAGAPLDRANNQRRDAAYVKSLLDAESSRVVLFHGLRPMLLDGGRGSIAWLPFAAVREAQVPVPSDWKMEPSLSSLELLLLGLEPGGTARFALDVSPLSDTQLEAALAAAASASAVRFTELRTASAHLSGADAAILAHGRSLLEWHSRHRHCGKCGAATFSFEGGIKRRCSRPAPPKREKGAAAASTAAAATTEYCGSEHYPRTDPVVITLATRGDHCLLGRHLRSPPGVYSALAGFMEPGESVEDALRREVKEESGVVVGRVHYHSSQPWPFPSSLMIACISEALSDAITVDPEELSDARWFHVDEAREMLERSLRADYVTATELRCPPPLAVAHQLIKSWVASRSDAAAGAATTTTTAESKL